MLGDGGKWVCGMERIAKQEKCVIYSFGASNLASSLAARGLIVGCAGINGESSFEAALLERAPGCEVWGYDFTVDSVRSHLKFDRDVLKLTNGADGRTVWP